MYLHLPEDIIQSACIQYLGIEIIFYLQKKLCTQYIFPVIFVLDPDGTGSVDHVV